MQKDVEYLIKLGEEGIEEEDLQNVLKEFEEAQTEPDITETYKQKLIDYKKKKSTENFESGVGGFRRSQ